MCLYPELIRNPKYKPNKKNGGIIPPITDERILYVPIGCQKCMECKKKKAMSWEIRLTEDIKKYHNGKFVTFTFSEKSLYDLDKQVHYKYEGYERDNAIATRAVRLFLKRFNEKYKKTLRHWLITELGQNNTERIHIHGIIWTDLPKAAILERWQYGNMGWELTWEQENNYVNGASIKYITKYVYKADEKHKNYHPIILTSNGIGNEYSQKWTVYNKFQGKDTNDHYRSESGHKMALPIYYRNQLYTEEEREKLWLDKLDKQVRYVNGAKYDVSKTDKYYLQALEYAKTRNTRLGHGGAPNWKQEEYEKQLRALKKQERNTKHENVCKMQKKSQ